MAIPLMEEDVEIISKLGDVPGSDDGLSATQLKNRFDLAGIRIKRFLNEVLIPHMNQIVDVQTLLNSILDSTLSHADKAANAKATGDALGKKLDKSGGTMSGNIAMNSNKIVGLGTPASDYDGANKVYVDSKVKGYVDDKVKVFSGTLTTSGWTAHPGDTGGYYQNVSVSGILTTDEKNKVELNFNDLGTSGADMLIVQARDSAWNEIYRSRVMSDGNVRFYSYEKPAVDLPFRITVWR